MKIAITGGSGFIGTQLCKILKEQGHDITIMDIAPSAAFPQDRQDVDVRDLMYHLSKNTTIPTSRAVKMFARPPTQTT
jgi:nucleoside-diphosphate-sugar epimerase